MLCRPVRTRQPVRQTREILTRRQVLLVQYAQANEHCVAIILADVARYGGEQAAVVIWARTVMAPSRNNPGRTAVPGEQIGIRL